MENRCSYTAAFKLKIIEYAKENGNRASSRKFGVGESSVREWRKMEGKLKKAPSKKRAFRGKSCKYPQVEQQLLTYVLDLRRSGYSVSTEMLMFEACKIARKINIPREDFKASYGWVRRFMIRNSLSIRRRTTLSQKLPEEYEEQRTKFFRYVIRLRKQKVYKMSQIGNADQTPLWFDMPETTTVHSVGDRSVQVRTTGADKQRCTVMLAITADGRKLTPYVIFKRKTIPKETFSAGIIVRAQEKGWMTEELMKDWINVVWESRLDALRYPSMLVLDSFRGHTTPAVKAKIGRSSDLVVIPGGMTKVLQPLDVVINRPFKVAFRHAYNRWMTTTDHNFTPSGRMKRASLPTVCDWIIEAWNSISAEMIIKSFKVTGISNQMDGTEDSMIYEDINCASDDEENSISGNENC